MTVNDVVNQDLAHTVLACEGALLSPRSGVASPDFIDLCDCEAGTSVPFPSGVTVFGAHVGKVLGLTAREKMGVVTNTQRVITMVKDPFSLGNRANESLIDPAMCGDASPSWAIASCAPFAGPEPAVSSAVCAGRPLPAWSEVQPDDAAVEVDFGPESVFGIHHLKCIGRTA